nr:MAG TPA: peptidase [Inoviridae sp.]
MNDLITALQGAFGFLGNEIYGIPIIAFIVIGCIFAIIGRFIAGKK